MANAVLEAGSGLNLGVGELSECESIVVLLISRFLFLYSFLKF